jgi:quercetin dioxygenase-like cupin family protein
MNIATLHTHEKTVSATPFFKGTEGTATAIQINRNQKLKEHLTKTPALLLCIEGRVGFEDENGRDEELFPGDYVLIEPMVKHWVNAIATSQLILIK